MAIIKLRWGLKVLNLRIGEINYMKSAGIIIKGARLNKNLTQEELGKKSGVGSNTIARIERGIQKPSFSTLKKLSKVLDIDINNFPD